MQVSTPTITSYGWIVLLTVLLVLLCVACGQTGQKDDGGEPEPIDAGETRADTAGSGETNANATGSGEASAERVEVSTLATDLEVPWSFAFLPDGDADRKSVV